MISQFFILSPRGDVIIRRDYLGNVPKVGVHGEDRGLKPPLCLYTTAACSIQQQHTVHTSMRPPCTPRHPLPTLVRLPTTPPNTTQHNSTPNMQTSSETFFRASKFHKAGDEAPPVFIVDGVSYLSIKVGVLLWWLASTAAAAVCLCATVFAEVEKLGAMSQ